MTTPLPLAADQAAAARHGSYCPKMCSFACPVTAATGRDDAVPWSFHRTVTDLAEGRLAAGSEASTRLTACTGCLACQIPCVFDQDVPAQVRAGRAALREADVTPPGVSEAVARVADGTSPYPMAGAAGASGTGATPGAAATPTVTVVVGCRDDGDTVAAAFRLLRAAGEEPAAVVPHGCCGATLRDLGTVDAADAARDRLGDDLRGGAALVVVLDPHCLEETREAVPDREVVHVVSMLHRALGEGRLVLEQTVGSVTFHDPCLLARGAGLTEEPRALLRAAGGTIAEPEGHRRETVCSGAGMALELLDEPTAEATAARRRAILGRTGARLVTACSGARHRLTTSSRPVADLLQILADALPEEHP